MPVTYANIQWTTTPSKYLGVPLQHYKDTQEYWKEQTDKAREKTQKWGGRDLSIFSRATVCNIFIIARVWYVLQALHMSRMSIQRLHRVLAVFVWNSSWERVSRTNLFLPVRSGGLGLIHLFVRQIVSRFVYYRNERNPFLRSVMQVRLANALPDVIVSSCAHSNAMSADTCMKLLRLCSF